LVGVAMGPLGGGGVVTTQAGATASVITSGAANRVRGERMRRY
jgi:hypothetical protein